MGVIGKFLKRSDNVGNIALAVFSISFGFMLMMVQKIVINGSGIPLGELEAKVIGFDFFDIIKLCLYSVLTFFGMNYIETLIDLVQRKRFEARKSDFKVFLFFAGVMILCWLPCVLSFYPGGLFSDTLYSIAVANGEALWSNHHPVLYTLSWKILYDFGGVLRLTNHQIFFLYTLLQMAAMAVACAYFLYSLYRWGVSAGIIFVATMFYGLFTVIPLYIVSLWKDTPFSIAFFVFSTFLFNLFYSEKNEEPLDVKSIAVYCILSYLVSFLRNNGLYVYILFSLVLLLCYLCRRDRKRKAITIVSLVLVCVFSIIRGPIYNRLGWNGDDKIESLGIPLQQVCYIIQNNGKVTEEELDVINAIIPVEDIDEYYCPVIVDQIKFAPTFHHDYFNENVTLFMKTYVHIVLRNPAKALRGMALANEGFWDPTHQYDCAYVNNFMWPGLVFEMSDKIEDWFGFSLQNDYSTRIKVSAALFAWVIFAALTAGFRRHREGTLLALVPAMGLWLTTLIATPIAYSLRYVFGLVLVLPIGIVVMILPKEHND